MVVVVMSTDEGESEGDYHAANMCFFESLLEAEIEFRKKHGDSTPPLDTQSNILARYDGSWELRNST